MTNRAQAQIDELRQRVDALELQASPLEQQHFYPPARLVVARLQKTIEGAGGFDRTWTAIQQDHTFPGGAGKVQNDSFPFLSVLPIDRDSIPQSYSHDVVLMEFGDKRILLPTPQKIMPIVDDGSGAPFGRKGHFADISIVAGAPFVDTFRDSLPLLNVNPKGAFIASEYPYALGNVYPGFHVWPYLDSGGGSTISGVDPDKGFFMVFTMPPGDIADTIVLSDSATIPSGGGTVTVDLEVDRDGQGNVLDVRLVVS